VAWKDTWLPESELVKAKELVDEFTLVNECDIRGRKSPLQQNLSASGHPNAQDVEKPTKQRGRPRRGAKENR
jgi:hypothetical protein